MALVGGAQDHAGAVDGGEVRTSAALPVTRPRVGPWRLLVATVTALCVAAALADRCWPTRPCCGRSWPWGSPPPPAPSSSWWPPPHVGTDQGRLVHARGQCRDRGVPPPAARTGRPLHGAARATAGRHGPRRDLDRGVRPRGRLDPALARAGPRRLAAGRFLVRGALAGGRHAEPARALPDGLLAEGSWVLVDFAMASVVFALTRRLPEGGVPPGSALSVAAALAANGDLYRAFFTTAGWSADGRAAFVGSWTAAMARSPSHPGSREIRSPACSTTVTSAARSGRRTSLRASLSPRAWWRRSWVDRRTSCSAWSR